MIESGQTMPACLGKNRDGHQTITHQDKIPVEFDVQADHIRHGIVNLLPHRLIDLRRSHQRGHHRSKHEDDNKLGQIGPFHDGAPFPSRVNRMLNLLSGQAVRLLVRRRSYPHTARTTKSFPFLKNWESRTNFPTTGQQFFLIISLK